MEIQVFYIDEEDDIASIRDRLEWATKRRVLLVLPVRGDVLTEFLDLTLLQRHAESSSLEIGLVTTDHRVINPAKALGLPTFSTVRSASKSKRGWWRGRRRKITVGQPTRLDADDYQEVDRRKKTRPSWQKWTMRYAAMVFGLLALAFLFIAAAYSIPGATITLHPEVIPLEIKRQIVADPSIENVDVANAAVPGRILSSIQECQY